MSVPLKSFTDQAVHLDLLDKHFRFSPVCQLAELRRHLPPVSQLDWSGKGTALSKYISLGAPVNVVCTCLLCYPKYLVLLDSHSTWIPSLATRHWNLKKNFQFVRFDDFQHLHLCIQCLVTTTNQSNMGTLW